MRWTWGLISLVAVVLASGCGSTSDDTTHSGAAGFTTRIDNPYWPMAPGSRWVSREREGGYTYRVVVTVTPRTKSM